MIRHIRATLVFLFDDRTVIIVNIHATIELDSSAIRVTGVSAVVLFVFLLIVKILRPTRVSVPEPQVGNRVIGLCTFQAANGVRQTVFLYALIKALVFDLVGSNAKNRRDCIGGEHDGQSAGEPVENESCAGLAFHGGHSEFG